MANYAKYWYLNYKGIEFTDALKKDLESFGFTTESCLNHGTDQYEIFYKIGCSGKLIFIYAEHEQLSWKQGFELLCKKHKIPIQKWMEG